MDMTVVYYTSNADHPRLEESIRAMIAQNSGGLPIVSVSHRPIDFGRNLVVGDIERSTENIFMQLEMGAASADTKYIAVCEADFLVTEKFFAFRPPHEAVYCWPKDGWITWSRRPDRYYPMVLDDLVGIVGREHLLVILKDLRKGVREKRRIRSAIRRAGESGLFDMGPVVTLKTIRQMHRTHPFDKKHPVREIPMWGTAEDAWGRVR